MDSTAWFIVKRLLLLGTGVVLVSAGAGCTPPDLRPCAKTDDCAAKFYEFPQTAYLCYEADFKCHPPHFLQNGKSCNSDVACSSGYCSLGGRCDDSKNSLTETLRRSMDSK